jgi:D-glycero-D-manno-heptose 1,7-bisphosphate phosphatase
MSRIDLFLDRDGTLIEDPGYINSPERVIFLEGVLDGLQEFRKRNYRLHLVSNQSSVGRNIISDEQFLQIDARFQEILLHHSITFDTINYCFHTPFENCNCRKPKTGMFLEVEARFPNKRKLCGMIGNSKSDQEAADKYGIIYWNIEETIRDSFYQQSKLVLSHFERILCEAE